MCMWRVLTGKALPALSIWNGSTHSTTLTCQLQRDIHQSSLGPAGLNGDRLPACVVTPPGAAQQVLWANWQRMLCWLHRLAVLRCVAEATAAVSCVTLPGWCRCRWLLLLRGAGWSCHSARRPASAYSAPLQQHQGCSRRMRTRRRCASACGRVHRAGEAWLARFLQVTFERVT